MKLKSIAIRDFKRFSDLTVTNLPETAKMVLLTGPNGSGKTSLFEAFNFWNNYVKSNIGYEAEYYERGDFRTKDWPEMLQRIKPEFYGEGHDVEQQDPSRKEFYIRSAYRHEADFTSEGIQNTEDILHDTHRPQFLMQQEQRVSENYQRMVATAVDSLFNDPSARTKTGEAIAEELIGELRAAVVKVFPDLQLEGPGNPMSGGTFRFAKGTTSNFHYKNLSGGEKAAFDLLLDFVIKRRAFDDTIFCIDEPELHMHTQLQARLLQVMFDLLPNNCQLWLSTHSIGMARKAAELIRKNPQQVAFIDFHDRDFDQPTQMEPIQPDRAFWQRMFSTALDDLAELVAPKYIVFCEGRSIEESGKDPSFDATVYRAIFEQQQPDLEFIPLGGNSSVQKYGQAFGNTLAKITPGTTFWKLIDKDDRNGSEIAALAEENTYVLSRRDIESFLWDREVLTTLCVKHGKPDAVADIEAERQQQLSAYP